MFHAARSLVKCLRHYFDAYRNRHAARALRSPFALLRASRWKLFAILSLTAWFCYDTFFPASFPQRRDSDLEARRNALRCETSERECSRDSVFSAARDA